MPRHLRVEFPGAIYHVTIRGNGRRDIFGDDHDRERFLRRLAESVEAYGIRLYLFCLMTNHGHFLLETPSTNLSRFMQSLETGYTVFYNLRHGMSGHLFQGRYKAKLVEGDEYLLKLSRYVHLNPVHISRWKKEPLTQRIAYLRKYPWSSYRSYIGEEKKLAYVTYGPVLAETGVKERRQQREYRGYVEEGLATTDAEFLEVLKRSPAAIGGDEFRAWVRDTCIKMGEKAAKPEDVSFRREVLFVSKDKVLEVTCKHLGVRPRDLRERRRNSVLRPIAARMLVKYAGLTHRQVADTLGMKSGVSASLQARRAMALKEESNSAKLIAAIEVALNGQMNEMRPA
ncbi:MAG: transposase [Kiritimatiellaeota bacterium]|nr:transposase [Kiritimatiellota bacterium]